MPVYVAEEPLSCVAVGTGRCLEEFDKLEKVFSGTVHGA